MRLFMCKHTMVNIVVLRRQEFLLGIFMRKAYPHLSEI